LEGLVFHTKSRKEQLQAQSESLAETAATVAEQLRERVVPAVGQAAEVAKEWGQPRVVAARDWAKPRLEHGIEVAAPKLESAVSGLAPKVDTARDKIVDELLPRITEAITAWAAASAAAKDEAVSRGAGAAAVISGDAVASPKRKGKKGKIMLILGLLSATGAGAAAFMKKSAPKDDPWATPLEDPYVAPSTGRHSRLESLDTTLDTAVPTDDLNAAAVDDAGLEIVAAMDGDAASVPPAPTSEDDSPANNGKGKDHKE
jgi:hypothetical protein